MQRKLCWTIGTVLAICGGVFAQADRRAVSPWLEESDQLPPPVHHMELTAALERHQINRLDPLIVRVTLTNRDPNPLTLETRRDGAPFILASLVARGDGPFERHHQWLMRNSPEYRPKELDVTLQRGESTSGELLILFGGPPTGLPFADEGNYRVQIACQPDRHFAPIYSNELIVNVVPGNGANEAFIRDLDAFAWKYHGYDRETMVKNVGSEYHVGIELLQRVIRQDRPLLIAPDQNPQDHKTAELVEYLTGLLERHPNSAYSGYVARYLGLVHFATLWREVSTSEEKIWRETGQAPQTSREEILSQPTYEKAMRCLTVADQFELWPRSTATLHLVGLHALARDWEKALENINRFRSRNPGSLGQSEADNLEHELNKQKAKLGISAEQKTTPQ